MTIFLPKEKFLTIAGMMSGTSVDGVDLAIITTNGHIIDSRKKPTFKKFPKELQNSIKSLINNPNNIDISMMLQMSNEITTLHAQTLMQALELNNMKSSQLDFIGFHGQTIYHCAQKHISLQIGNPQLLAKQTNVPVATNFRDNDITHGGEGAPIVPIYHKALIKQEDLPIAIINIGGVANISAIYINQVIAGDIGPGNALIDDWIHTRLNKDYDKNGNIASIGKIHKKIVETYIASKKFFQQPLPKSLDRNEFHEFNQGIKALTTEDGAATLTFFTAAAISHSLKLLPHKINKIILTGGGRKNQFLKKILTEEFNLKIISIDDYNTSPRLNGDFIEAEAMAFIAARSIYNLPYTFPKTTGVSYPVSGGTIFRAETPIKNR